MIIYCIISSRTKMRKKNTKIIIVDCAIVIHGPNEIATIVEEIMKLMINFSFFHMLHVLFYLTI